MLYRSLAAYGALGLILFAQGSERPAVLPRNSSDAQVVVSVQTVTKVRYTKYAVKVRSGPGTSYKTLKTLAAGTKVTVVASKNSWSKISSGGWIRSDLLSANKPSVSAVNYRTWSQAKLTKFCAEEGWSAFSEKVREAERQTGGLCCPNWPKFFTAEELKKATYQMCE